MIRHITEELEVSFDDSDESDEEKFSIKFIKSLKKSSKKSHTHEKFAVCKLKLLSSLDYKRDLSHNTKLYSPLKIFDL